MKKRYFPVVGLFLLLGIIFFPHSSHAQKRAHAENWMAMLVATEGNVSLKQSGETQWTAAKPNDLFFAGDMIRVGDKGRAALTLRNESTIRLDQNTTINFDGWEGQTLLLNLLEGAAQFFSRIPRSLKIRTPHVNGSVKGTEFFVRVEENQTFISIFEGQVEAVNDSGSLLLLSGQAALAKAGQAPMAQVVIRPRDAVQWALYYPPVFDWKILEFPAGPEKDWQAAVKRSADNYLNGDIPGAFKSLEGVSPDTDAAPFYTYRAALFLSVGRVNEAGEDIRKALAQDPRNSHAYALQSVIAVVQNDKDKALELANRAVELDPRSAVSLVARSYARQARFELEGALSDLKEAVTLAPDNTLALARLSELWLSLGYLDKALDAARRAASLSPRLARTQVVLGFAYLMDIKISEALAAFSQAIEFDQADPLARLGLGLTKIRQGELAEGRNDIEISVSLDPNNSLLRSYLGKAYYEEKRSDQAALQFKIAKELDPQDPTPWLYDAVQKQTLNRPVEALKDMQKSIALNDNRAVYRSRLLLDEDLAARSVSLARIYEDLGFQWLALNEGWKSLNIDPANFSAHRFLADLYFSLPRHEAARVSELLQSQLLQPINIMPIQPQLAETRLLTFTGTGPRNPSYNEYTPLFARNQLALLVDGVAGNRGTFAEDVIQSGLWGKYSYSLGQFHSQTDGFRSNNDSKSNVYDAFIQMTLSSKTSGQLEYRHTSLKAGDLNAFFDDAFFSLHTHENDSTETLRFGFRHSFAPGSDLIGSAMYFSRDEDHFFRPPTMPFPADDFFKSRGYSGELQHLYRSAGFNLTAGAGHFRTNNDDVFEALGQSFPSENGTTHNNIYVYSNILYPKQVTWTLGVSADFFNGGVFDLNEHQINPKFGAMWRPFPGTTVRGAVFRTFKRTFLTNQTIEPTQIAGFNQFFLFESDGTDVWNYGIGLDQKLMAHLFAGAEFSYRDLSIPVLGVAPPFPITNIDATEKHGRAYLYWTPHPRFAMGPEYQYEQFNNPDNLALFGIVKVDTHRVGFGLNFFHPSGFLARLRPMYVAQRGDFFFNDGVSRAGDSEFFVFDASLGYRLPKRLGLIKIEARNLFDESFRFQDTDPMNPQITPGRFILGAFTLSF